MKIKAKKLAYWLFSAMIIAAPSLTLAKIRNGLCDGFSNIAPRLNVVLPVYVEAGSNKTVSMSIVEGRTSFTYDGSRLGCYLNPSIIETRNLQGYSDDQILVKLNDYKTDKLLVMKICGRNHAYTGNEIEYSDNFYGTHGKEVRHILATVGPSGNLNGRLVSKPVRANGLSVKRIRYVVCR